MIREFLPLVSKPTRYLGSEINSIHKDLQEVDLKFALAFPDAYEIGMSNVGFQILYHILNKREDIACERVYAPWVDMEDMLRTKGMPLFSLESSLPLKDFDIIGFSLPYELCNTNILNMMDLSGIPFFAKDRDKSWPLVIAGGSCCFNPEPVADFFDAIVIGDGEEVILDICDCFLDWKDCGGEKDELYRGLSKIEGVYVPSFFNIEYHSSGKVDRIVPLKEDYCSIKKRAVTDLNEVDYPSDFIVPFMKIIHDRLSLEITRGCTRGCRFCQAGMTYRPVRERSEEIIKEIIERGIQRTGYDDLSFLSLNTGDYSCIKSLIVDVMRKYCKDKIAVSLPSLRPETLTPKLIAEIKKVRKTGITIAPEAGTQRLRNIINKGITEEDILKTADTVFAAGWNSIKLYFMIGLPTEKEEDIDGIIALSKKIRSLKGDQNFTKNVNVSISTFVPKPQTPFQWESQISLKEITEKHDVLKSKIAGKGLALKWQDPRLSILEGVFSKGDRRLSEVLINAHRLGCRLDAWSEHFRSDLWERAFIDAGLNKDFYNRRKLGYEEILPWDHLDCLVSKDFLIEERERGLKGVLTPDCRIEGCTGCGVCNDQGIKLVTSTPVFYPEQMEYLDRASSVKRIQRYRIQFSKLDDARFLSHLELVNLFCRAIMRAKIPMRYSKGFHPLPRIIFGKALPVGIESLEEYVDIEIEGNIDSHEIKDRLKQQLPMGIKILKCWGIPLKSAPFSDNMRCIKYLVCFNNNNKYTSVLSDDSLKEAVSSFLNKKNLFIIREKKGKIQKVDLRSVVDDVKLRDKSTLEISLRYGMGNNVRPFDMVRSILNIEEERVRLLRILRV